MEKVRKSEESRNRVLLLEIIMFMFIIILYNFISKNSLINNEVISNIIKEFSLSITVVIIIRIITAIITVFISVIISSFIMSIFFNKFENVEFDKNKLKVIVYKAFLLGMILNYLILTVIYLMGGTANLNITSIISYFTVSSLLGILLNKDMNFKIKNILIVSFVFFVLNSGAAILQLIKLIWNQVVKSLVWKTDVKKYDHLHPCGYGSISDSLWE